MTMKCRRAIRVALLVLAAFSTVFASACSSVSASGTVEEAPDDPAAKKDGDGASEKESAKKARERERTLRDAKMGLQIAEIECAQSLRKSEQALADKRRTLEWKRADLEHFESSTRPTRLEEDSMGIDRSTQRAEEANDELQQLETMYEEEEFAELTKELVIKRGRRSAEMAARSLDVQRAKSASLQQHELPRKRAELAEAVAKAERELAEAEIDLQKTRLANEMKLQKARDKVEDAEREEKDAS